MHRSHFLRGTLGFILLTVISAPACRSIINPPKATVTPSKKSPSKKVKVSEKKFIVSEKEPKEGIGIHFKGQTFKLSTEKLDISENEKPLPSVTKTYLSSMDETKYEISSARINNDMRLEGFRETVEKQANSCFAFIFDDFSQDILLFKEYQTLDSFLRSGNSPVFVNLTGKICIAANNSIDKINLDSRFNSKNMLNNLSYLLNLDQAEDTSVLAKSSLARFYESLELPDLVEKSKANKPSLRLSSHLGTHNLFRSRVWKKVLESGKSPVHARKKGSSASEPWKVLYQRNQFALVRPKVKLAQILLSNELSKRSPHIAGGFAYLKTPKKVPAAKRKLTDQAEFTFVSPLYDGDLTEDKTWSKIKRSGLSSKDLIIQFSEALEFLHTQKLTHGSIQLDKLLYDQAHKRLLLSDLSHSSNIREGALSREKTAHQNMAYQAHELRDKKPYDPFKAEIYSWGLIALEIKGEGSRPILKVDFKTDTKKPNASDLPKTKPAYRGALLAAKKLNLKEPLDRLIFDALSPKPSERPSIEKILQTLK